MERPVVEKELTAAAERGNTADLLQLLQRGAPFIVDNAGRTVLHVAVAAGQIETVSALLDRGCDSNVLDFVGRSALQVAAGGGYLEIVKLLIRAGAVVDHQDEIDRSTPLHEASKAGYSQTLTALCKSRGANLYLKNRSGSAPIHLCCQSGHNQSCRVLLTHGCRPDLKNNFGDTPLHTAARYGHAGVTRILVSANCKCSLQNKNGDTALHIAAAMGRRKLSRILLEAGIDTTLRNHQRETARDIAVRKNLVDVVDILDARENASVTPSCQSSLKLDDFDSPLRNIISDLEPGIPTHVGGTKEQRSDREDTFKEFLRRRPGKVASEKDGECGSSSHATSSTRHKKQKYKGLSHGIKSKGCDCSPLLEKIGRKISDDRMDIMKHIRTANKVTSERLDEIEKRSRKEVMGLQELLKESLAEERGYCQDRGERQSVRRGLDLDKRESERDILLRGDIGDWLQAVIKDIESKYGGEDQVLLRKLGRKKSKRETKAIWSEIRNGSLRRSNSLENINDTFQEVNHQENGNVHSPNIQLVHGLKISDMPLEKKVNESHMMKTRMRHNSEGNYDDVNLMQDVLLKVSDNKSNIKAPECLNESQYENVSFCRGQPTYHSIPRSFEQFSPSKKEDESDNTSPPPPLPKRSHPSIPPDYEHLSTMSTGAPEYSQTSSVRSANFNGLPYNLSQVAVPMPGSLNKTHHILPQSSNSLQCPELFPSTFKSSPLACQTTSDCDTVDSHNDSGYSTRLGISSGGPSPVSDCCTSSPSSTSSILLDPAAIHMVPSTVLMAPNKQWQTGHASTKAFGEKIVITSSSLV